jgi:positive regulator of sigma E activity
MIEVGIVGNIKNDIAEIFIDTAGCENCDLKDHCRTKLKSSLKARTNGFELSMGDRVEVKVTELPTLKATSIVYGIPFVMFLSGFFIGYSISEILGLVGGLIGLGASFFVTRKVGDNFVKKNLPVVVKKLNILI